MSTPSRSPDLCFIDGRPDGMPPPRAFVWTVQAHAERQEAQLKKDAQ
ncbi:hypothetical protein [Pararhodobacter sp.]